MRPDELMARAAAVGIDLITTFEQSVPQGQERQLQNYAGPIQKQTRVYRRPEWTGIDAGAFAAHVPDHLYAAFAYRFAGDESQRKNLKRALMVRTSEIAKRDGWKRIRKCANCDGTGLTHEIVYDQALCQTTREMKRRARGKPGEWETRPVTCVVCRSFGLVELSNAEWQSYKKHAAPELKKGVGQVFVIEQLVDLAIFEEWLTVHYVTGLLQLARDRLWAGLIGISQIEWENRVLPQYRQVQCVIDGWCGTAYGLISMELHEDEERTA